MSIAAAFAVSMLLPIVRFGWPSPFQIAAALLIAALTIVYGKPLARWIQPPSGPMARVCEVVAGFAALSLVHFLATVVLSLRAPGALSIDSVVGAALFVWSRRRFRHRDRLWASGEERMSAVALDAMMLVAVAAIAALWSREAASAMPTAQATGVFHAWQDFFLHAAEIVYLRDYPAFDRHSLYLAGSLQPLYHRASYAMPALYAAIGRVPALETATSFWMPLGLTLCGFAAYGFGAAVGGRAAGVAAVVAVFLLPDASAYGLRNTFLSFHWLIEISPGSGFGIAIVLVALGLFVSSSGRSGKRLLLCVALAAAAVGFRVQIATLGVASLLVLVLAVWRPVIQRTTALIALAGLVVLVWGGLLLLEQIALAPHFLSAQRDPLAFFGMVHGFGPDQGALFFRLTRNHGAIWTVVVGYLLMLVACLGIFLPAATLLPLMSRAGRLPWRVGVVPLVLVFAHLGMILVMPKPTYNFIDDYGHRSFVLTYAITAATVGAVIGRQLFSVPGYGTSHGFIRTALAVAFIVVALLVPLRDGRSIQERWGPNFTSIPMTSDAVLAARHIRTQSKAGEVVLASHEDPLAMFVALSERTAYVSRGNLYRMLGGDSGNLAALRSREHQALAALTSFDQLREFGRQHRIDWYLLEQGDMPAWPQALKDRCAYCGSTVRAFDLR